MLTNINDTSKFVINLNRDKFAYKCMLTNINDTSKFVINLNRDKTRKISVGGF
jgi:hypothetical protein